MIIKDTPLKDLKIIEPDVYNDKRGFFLETFKKKSYEKQGIETNFVQDNFSRSTMGVLRGLHFQKNYPQGKLVRVSRGRVYDVAVEIRINSSTFGQWYAIILDDIDHNQLWIPPGFAHGFCVLSDTADFQYKCTEYYHPEDEAGIIWNDPDIGIDWPIENPIISEKDQKNFFLKDLFELDDINESLK